jgi:hypothetical protein
MSGVCHQIVISFGVGAGQEAAVDAVEVVGLVAFLVGVPVFVWVWDRVCRWFREFPRG